VFADRVEVTSRAEKTKHRWTRRYDRLISYVSRECLLCRRGHRASFFRNFELVSTLPSSLRQSTTIFIGHGIVKHQQERCLEIVSTPTAPNRNSQSPMASVFSSVYPALRCNILQTSRSRSVLGSDIRQLHAAATSYAGHNRVGFYTASPSRGITALTVSCPVLVVQDPA
jgi:hypothetical protein